MGTTATAYGGKGSKGRAANGDRPVGAASCRREQHTMVSCQNPSTPRLHANPPPPFPPSLAKGEAVCLTYILSHYFPHFLPRGGP